MMEDATLETSGVAERPAPGTPSCASPTSGRASAISWRSGTSRSTSPRASSSASSARPAAARPRSCAPSPGSTCTAPARIEQAGRDISILPASQRDFGIVFQSYALFPNLTIEKNIAYGLENVGRDRTETARRVAELLTLVGLPEQAKKYPAQLSGGQQQRIALARAIATSPGLLLLDEPLSALDAKVRVSLRHEIKTLQRKLGVTTIMVTHDQEEALAMADRIVVMNHGVIEQIGTPTEIYREPASLFVADFIGEANQLPARAIDGDRIGIGTAVLACAGHDLAAGADAVTAIRPEDVIPYETAGRPDAANILDVTVGEMEFLGSFWRTRLRSAALGDAELIADFSMNAVRRLSLAEGKTMSVELPPERLLVFPRDAR